LTEYKTKEECEAANGTWTAENTCQMAAAKSVEMPINEKLIGVMKEYMDEVMKQFKVDIEKRLADEKLAIENELVTSVRTGLGIQKDPVIHLSEVEGVVRKIVLNNAPDVKKTLTETTDKPLEGADLSKQLPDLEKQFSDIMAKKGGF